MENYFWEFTGQPVFEGNSSENQQLTTLCLYFSYDH